MVIRRGRPRRPSVPRSRRRRRLQIVDKKYLGRFEDAELANLYLEGERTVALDLFRNAPAAITDALEMKAPRRGGRGTVFTRFQNVGELSHLANLQPFLEHYAGWRKWAAEELVKSYKAGAAVQPQLSEFRVTSCGESSSL